MQSTFPSSQENHYFWVHISESTKMSNFHMKYINKVLENHKNVLNFSETILTNISIFVPKIIWFWVWKLFIIFLCLKCRKMRLFEWYFKPCDYEFILFPNWTFRIFISCPFHLRIRLCDLGLQITLFKPHL